MGTELDKNLEKLIYRFYTKITYYLKNKPEFMSEEIEKHSIKSFFESDYYKLVLREVKKSFDEGFYYVGTSPKNFIENKIFHIFNVNKDFLRNIKKARGLGRDGIYPMFGDFKSLILLNEIMEDFRDILLRDYPYLAKSDDNKEEAIEVKDDEENQEIMFPQTEAQINIQKGFN